MTQALINVAASIRPSVAAFAAISFALRAALLLLLSLPALLGWPVARSGVLLALFAGVIALTFARSVVVRRLSAGELAVVQFWSITPLLMFLVCGMLGAIPILVSGQIAAHFHWSEATLRNLAVFVFAGALISSALLIRVLWIQFRASLPATPGERDHSA